MSTQTHSSHEESVTALVAHEMDEQVRVESVQANHAEEIAALNDTYTEEKKKIEQEERAKEQADLQAFMTEELPKIGEASAASRATALEHVDVQARKELPKALNTLLEKAVSGVLIQ